MQTTSTIQTTHTTAHQPAAHIRAAACRLAAAAFAAGLFAAPAFAAELYAAKSAPLAQNGKQIGRIIVGTAYERAGKSVKITAWRPVGSKMLYGELGVLSASAEITADADVAVLSRAEDEYENEWEQVQLSAELAAQIDAAADPIAGGKALFEERCGTCHALHPVDEFSKNVWPATVKSMQDSAGLDEDEYFTVVKYLQRVAPSDDE